MTRARRAARRLAVAVLALPLAAASVSAGAAAAPPLRSGTSAADAAASCWEAKQADPGAADGIYWLQTPQLVAPERFYCDMTTDGGGWVLIARGRQGWRPEYQGRGTAAEVRGAVTGPAAFDVRELPSKTVDALLGGRPVSSLRDGVRLRRAMNPSGSRWQEVRFRLPHRDRWVWSFGAGLRVGSFDFASEGGTVGGTGGTTESFGNDRAYLRVETRANDPGMGAAAGWSYGSRVGGSPGPDSYLWSGSRGAGYARPFTQVFLRPELLSSKLTYPALPDGGTPAHSLRPLLQSDAEPQQWGVTGRAENDDSGYYTEAQTATQVGDTVFVGGNFARVQKGADPGPDGVFDQSYLAGFDVHTGEPVRSFRPTFNGQVKKVVALPNGKLVVGGMFTRVDGQAVRGLVALDPKTGAIDPSWTVAVQNRLSGHAVEVWALQVHGPWLYVGGAFTHLRGGKQTTAVFARDAARVSVADGTVDPNWNPDFNGTVLDLDISPDGNRVYAAGYLTSSGGHPVDSLAVVGTADGAPLVTGLRQPHFSSPDDGHYQQTVLTAGGRVWLGGSEHSLFSYSPSDFGLLSTNITKVGGDFQASLAVDGVVYAGCHCRNWNYSGADSWPDVGNDWTEADKIDYVGAWDASTGQFLPGFNVWVRTTHGQGLWGVFRDSTGTVWMLGDFRQARRVGGGFEWVGGFVRYAPRDTVPPSTPGKLAGGPAAGGTQLSWSASSDDRTAVHYEVLRDDRVIATTTATSVTVPAAGGSHRYAVRAVDAAGNRSASTPAQAITG